MHDQRDPIRHQGRQPVASLEPEGEVAGGEAGALLLQLGPGQAPVGGFDRDRIRVSGKAGPQQMVEWPRRLGERRSVDLHGGIVSRRARQPRSDGSDDSFAVGHGDPFGLRLVPAGKTSISVFGRRIMGRSCRI